MFSFTHQPPLVSLFSSTGSIPLSLFSTHTDLALPSDSFIHLLDDATSLPTLAAPTSIISPAPLHSESHPPEQSGKIGYLLGQTVLHIQSPTLTSTFIQCPPVTRSAGSGARERLTLKHPWMCMQVRNLGREWSFEVGMVDTAGREGVIRCSTFQVSGCSEYRTSEVYCRNVRLSERASPQGVLATTPSSPIIFPESFGSSADILVYYNAPPPYSATSFHLRGSHTRTRRRRGGS